MNSGSFTINEKKHLGFNVSIKDAVIENGEIISGKLFFDGRHVKDLKHLDTINVGNYKTCED
jgi:hypothetical protein